MPAYPTTEADFTYLAGELNANGLVYIHLVDHSSMGAPPVPESMTATFRRVFKRSLIPSEGYDDAVRAEGDLQAGKADRIAFGARSWPIPIWSRDGTSVPHSMRRT